jgi:predicted DNA-binding transcriptional regulator AlpA
MWGRFDKNRADGGWRAFTTDPIDHTLGWAVRYHPEHGRTVLLLSDGDTSSLHTDWDGEPLLFRAGGYWWNGSTWDRPGQVWDPVAQDYERRKARAAVTVSAADMLDGRAQPNLAYIGKVAAFDREAERPDNWLDHLALWAQHHQEQEGALPLERCVVDVSSPELTAAQLIGAPEMAELAGITASTLRAYISRGNSEVPLPQATIGGRDQWARAVAQDWVEARKRSYQGVGEAMSAGDRDSLSPGAAELRDRFAADFQHALYDRPTYASGGCCATATRSPLPRSRANSPGRWPPASTRSSPPNTSGAPCGPQSCTTSPRPSRCSSTTRTARTARTARHPRSGGAST